MILADRVQLQQVIINLVMNGIEAMQSVTDRPRELVIRSRQDETHQVLVSVTDCGVGISAENADRLFQRLLHHQIRRYGYGTLDLPFDRGSSRGTSVSFRQCWARCDISIRPGLCIRRIRRDRAS